MHRNPKKVECKFTMFENSPTDCNPKKCECKIFPGGRNIRTLPQNKIQKKWNIDLQCAKTLTQTVRGCSQIKSRYISGFLTPALPPRHAKSTHICIDRDVKFPSPPPRASRLLWTAPNQKKCYGRNQTTFLLFKPSLAITVFIGFIVCLFGIARYIIASILTLPIIPRWQIDNNIIWGGDVIAQKTLLWTILSSVSKIHCEISLGPDSSSLFFRDIEILSQNFKR